MMALFSLPLLALGTASGLAVAYSRQTLTVNKWNAPLAYMEKIGKVTILMPTLNEERWVERALASLENQNVRAVYPDYFETVVADSDSEDATVEIAQKYARVISVEKGKLTAIDTAIRQTNSEIIVAVDGDSFYDCNFLNLLLTHFEDPETVGVSGTEIIEGNNVWTVCGLLLENYVYTLKPRMQGRGCAYRRSAYFATGGFDLSIDQKNVFGMMTEEEFGYWERLKQVGNVKREFQASVLTPSRRMSCAGCSEEENCTYCEQVRNAQRF